MGGTIVVLVLHIRAIMDMYFIGPGGILIFTINGLGSSSMIISAKSILVTVLWGRISIVENCPSLEDVGLSAVCSIDLLYFITNI